MRPLDASDADVSHSANPMWDVGFPRNLMGEGAEHCLDDAFKKLAAPADVAVACPVGDQQRFSLPMSR
jgi:hypothetical protein